MAKCKGYDHVKLGITFQELGALLGVRGMLESGTLTHVAIGDVSNYDSGKVVVADAHEFNMRQVLRKKGCGTLGCIGGAMALIMGIDAGNYVQPGAFRTSNPAVCSRSLVNLFYPDNGSDGLSLPDDWDRVTPEVAVLAIDQFLAGKEVRWETLVNQYGLTRAQAKRRARVAVERVCAVNAAHA